MQYGLTGEYMPEQQETSNTSRKNSDYKPNYKALNEIFSKYPETLKAYTLFYEDNKKPWLNLPDSTQIAEKEYQYAVKQAEYAQILRHTDLIIDEGQDLPMGYYESLMHLGFNNFFVVADQNQQITDDNSSLDELEIILGSNVYELTENFRNTTPIAKVCAHFYTDRASPLPKLPDRPSSIKPMLIDYNFLDKAIERVLREADRDDSKLIGVIVGSETKREDYFKKLNKIDINRDNPKAIVTTYSSNSISKRVDIDFSQGGIVVLSDKSVKGIEFDTVFVFLDGIKIFDEIAMMKRLYVMSSRAKDKLFFLQSKMYPSDVSKLLPIDTNIMQRIEEQ
jgi:DNA helicase IV